MTKQSKECREVGAMDLPLRAEAMLGNYRILDLTDRKGLLAGKILGCLGADVIKIEAPGGDPARNIGPFYKDQVHPEKSLFWFYTNTSKRGITLDITKRRGQALLKRLVKTADAVVESFTPGYLAGLGLGYDDLCRAKPDIVMTSISPFGQTGPYAHFKYSELTTWSMGGQTYVSGEPDRAPIGAYLHQADFQGGAQAAQGTMLALTHRDLTGEGQHVDVSIQQAVMLTLMMISETWDLRKVSMKRASAALVTPRPPLPPLVERLVYECKDGMVMFTAFKGGVAGLIASSEALKAWGVSEGYLQNMKDYDFRTYSANEIPQEQADLMRDSLAEFLKTKTMQEIMDRAVAESISICPANSMAGLWSSSQFRARGFWGQVVEHPELNDAFAYPGTPVDTDEALWRVWCRAPQIGEHNEEIYGGELGLSREQMALFKAAGVI